MSILDNDSNFGWGVFFVMWLLIVIRHVSLSDTCRMTIKV